MGAACMGGCVVRVACWAQGLTLMFFHLAKRLDYHVKSLGLMEKYKNNTDFRLRVKKLAAPAFVSVADDVATFESHAIHFLQDELPLLS